MSDYFGFDNWRSPNAYGSCDRFKGASQTDATWFLSAYWSSIGDRPQIKLKAVYTDGHAATFCSDDTTAMKVSKDQNGTTPFAPDTKGSFFLPRENLR